MKNTVFPTIFFLIAVISMEAFSQAGAPTYAVIRLGQIGDKDPTKPGEQGEWQVEVYADLFDSFGILIPRENYSDYFFRWEWASHPGAEEDSFVHYSSGWGIAWLHPDGHWLVREYDPNYIGGSFMNFNIRFWVSIDGVTGFYSNSAVVPGDKTESALRSVKPVVVDQQLSAGTSYHYVGRNYDLPQVGKQFLLYPAP